MDDTVEFLPMKFKTVNNGVYVTMPINISDVIQSIDQATDTAAGPNLFYLDNQCQLLETEGKKKFHTLVAKI